MFKEVRNVLVIGRIMEIFFLEKLKFFSNKRHELFIFEGPHLFLIWKSRVYIRLHGASEVPTCHFYSTLKEVILTFDS